MSEREAQQLSDPWGRDEPPAVAEANLEPLPPALAEIERMLEYGEDRPLGPGERLGLPGLADLPEVAALAAEGFEPLPNGLMGFDSAFLPAIWPREHRRWVRDRMPKFGLVSSGEDDLVLGPEMGGDTHQLWLLAREARSLGMAPPPRDRIWLLRSPWPSLRVSSLRLLFGQHRDRNGMGWDTTALMRAAQDLLPRSESELWSLWTGHQADAARAWRDAGRLGPESDTWVKLGLGPHHLDVLAAPMAEGARGSTRPRRAPGARSSACSNSRATTRSGASWSGDAPDSRRTRRWSGSGWSCSTARRPTSRPGWRQV